MFAEPQKEHQWLEQLVGDWTVTSACPMGPDQTPTETEWTETTRSLHGLWVVSEGNGQMPGGGKPTTSILSLGYDPQKGKYVGTFIASMMTHLWVYEDGVLDASGKVLTLNAEGPSFATPGKHAKYQDIFEIVDRDHRTLRSRMLGEDGEWRQVMQADYRRRK